MSRVWSEGPATTGPSALSGPIIKFFGAFLAILPLEALLWTMQVKPVSYIFLPRMKPVSPLQSYAQALTHGVGLV